MATNNINFFQKDIDKKIKTMCGSIKKDDELEVSFGSKINPISLKCFHDLLMLLIAKSSNNKIINTTTLDILYNYDDTASTYRLSILGIENINNFIDNNNIYNKNNILFSKQVRLLKSNNNIILINKIKSNINFIAIDEYDIRIKLSEEISNIDNNTIKLLENLDDTNMRYINFRYKQRYNLVIESNDNYIISIDLTDVKTNKNLRHIYTTNSHYELELDITFKKPINTKMFDKILDDLLNKIYINILFIEKFLQQSNILITKTEKNNIIKNLNKLVYNNENELYKDLPAMQSTSIEVYHILDIIPGNYAICDKADGERYFMMIYNSNVYLISNNLDVKKIKENVLPKYNLTVIDGEYLYLSNPYNKYIFLAFDILFLEGKDIRNEDSIYKRIIHLKNTLFDLFKIKLDIGNYEKDYNINNIIDYHKNNIITYLQDLKQNIVNSDDNNVISGKYYIIPSNIGNQNDIYKLSQILYETYTNGLIVKCPYVLDGIIFTPLLQKYTRSKKETKFSNLKWKPEENNSIDFYIEFERDPYTNKILKVYDKTISSMKVLEDYAENDNKDDYKSDTNNDNTGIFYQIANLYVGKMRNNQEMPILFQKENNNHIAYIIITDGYPRDLTGEIIQDKTVIEMSYDNINTINDKFRWKPLRTRYDKTESVMRYKRKYGNNFDTANRIWNSIINPITFNDIKLLANDITNKKHIDILKLKINAETINITRRDDEYYQLTTNIGKIQRTYTNWIKSNIIYNYCSPNYNKKLDILDIGVGRGGDINKFFHAKVNSLIGIDINSAGIYSGSDGAISRYNTFKKKLPQFPKMTFLVADARYKLDYNNQKTIGNLNDESVKNIKEVFGEDEESKNHNKFDIFNIQLVIHYLFENKNTFENMCYNINRYLKRGGLILITVFDGEIINKSFVDNEIKSNLINDDGKNMLLYSVIKKYGNIDLNDMSYENNLGNQIDMFNASLFEEGTYVPEYLVNPKFLIKEFYEKCNLKLIDTELFNNLYYKYKNFFDHSSTSESKKETNEFFKNVSEFYNLKNKNNECWFSWFKLFRYYVFIKL